MEASDEFESLGSVCVPDSQPDLRVLPQRGEPDEVTGHPVLGYTQIHGARQTWLVSLCMSDGLAVTSGRSG